MITETQEAIVLPDFNYAEALAATFPETRGAALHHLAIVAPNTKPHKRAILVARFLIDYGDFMRGELPLLLEVGSPEELMRNWNSQITRMDSFSKIFTPGSSV